MTSHIKMPDIEPIARYVVDGVTLTYSFSFPIFASEDLKIYLNGAEQISGYDITGAGNTAGGAVTFDFAPAQDTVITLKRVLPIERVTDFIQGGNFSAAALNGELDYLTAALQQIKRESRAMLKYADDEVPTNIDLPAKAMRANKVLGFDGDGNPIALSAAGTMASPDFTATGAGAITRTSSDKLAEQISVKDFGAIGDGLSDDTQAFQNALAAAQSVFVPAGTYLIASTLSIAAGKSLIGVGASSIIKTQNNNFVAIEVPANNVTLQNLRIEGGLVGVKLFGKNAECTQNTLSDLQVVGAETGLLLDGHNDSAKPCYWNNFARILIEQPLTHGIHLTKTGVGDTPNANRFHMCRVYSKGAATTGVGIYIEYGALNNSFIDCEVNINGATAQACVKAGAGAKDTCFVNLLTEGGNGLDNVVLESGSSDTVLHNLVATSDGGAIVDQTGGSYHAIGAGYPHKNTLRKTAVSDLTATLMRYDTQYLDATGTVALDLSHSIHIVSAYNGALTLELPLASTANGAELTIKKSDSSGNIITVKEAAGGLGIDRGQVQLGSTHDYVTVLSNVAEWFVKSSNRMASHPRYHDGSGTYDIDMAVDVYLVSSYNGALICRLPPANAPQANGRTVTIKKTDPSANSVTVTEQGGNGPDNQNQVLSGQYQAITCVSNGGAWYVISKI